LDTTRCENTNNDQLENYEDLNASVVTKNEEMKRKLLRYEDVIDENKELLKINDELKLSNSDMHTMNMKLTT
jgi:ABC-type Fe3+-citrate transport system substrate-binding protein